MRIRDNSITKEVLLMLAEYDAAWFSDIFLFMRSQVTDNNAERALNRLKDAGLIEKRESRIHTAEIRITEKGKRTVRQKWGIRYDIYKPYLAPTCDIKLYMRGMCDIRARLLMKSGNIGSYQVKVRIDEKPTVEELYSAFTSGSEEEKKKYESMLKTNGIYYSAQEIKVGLGNIGFAEPASYAGSRIGGVYMGWDKYYMVYVVPPSKNRTRIQLSNKVETRMCNAVRRFMAVITKEYILRSLDFVYGSTDTPGNNAIVITNGYASIKAMATGFKHGHDITSVKNDYLNSRGMDIAPLPVVREMYRPKKSVNSESVRPERTRMLLEHDVSLFNKVFAVPANITGIYGLHDLLADSAEDYRNKYIALKDNMFSGDEVIFDNLKFSECDLEHRHADGSVSRIVYMPAYDINLMTRIRQDHLENGMGYDILTRYDMAERIAAIVGTSDGRVHFYDIDDNNSEIKDVSSYDRNGYTEPELKKRQKIIVRKSEEAIKKKNLQDEIETMKEERNHLKPGSDERKEKNQKIREKTDEFNELVKRKKKKEIVTAYLDEDSKKKLKKIARERGIAMARLAGNIIREWENKNS